MPVDMEKQMLTAWIILHMLTHVASSTSFLCASVAQAGNHPLTQLKVKKENRYHENNRKKYIEE
jgi:hypothetical protein